MSKLLSDSSTDGEEPRPQPQPQPQRRIQPRSRLNHVAPPSLMDVRNRSRSPKNATLRAPNIAIKRILQRGKPMDFECDHAGMWPIFSNGDIVMFEPVVDIYPYDSTVKPGDIVFCQPTDDGPFYICSLDYDGSREPDYPVRAWSQAAASSLRVGDQSAASISRAGTESAASIPIVGYESAASARRAGDESAAALPRAEHESAASAPRVADESTASACRAEMLWDMYNSDMLWVGHCKGKMIYGRLKSAIGRGRTVKLARGSNQK